MKVNYKLYALSMKRSIKIRLLNRSFLERSLPEVVCYCRNGGNY